LAQLDEAVGDFESVMAQGYALDDAAARQLAGALAQRGDANTQSGKLDLAIADFETARRLAPEHGELWGTRAATAYLRQGEALSRLGKTDEALAAYDRAVGLRGRLHYAALNNRGAYNIRLKRYDRAITDLTSAIEVDDGRASAFYNRHIAYYRAGQPDKAEADLARARQLDPRISPPAPQ
jgi:tetratricopeptide (TPR) repeat protein